MKKLKKVLAVSLICSCFILSICSSVSFAGTQFQGYFSSEEMQLLEAKASQSVNLKTIHSGADDAMTAALAAIGLLAIVAAVIASNQDDSEN